MFIVLLSVFTAGVFDRLFASYSEGRIKCVSPNKRSFQVRLTIVNINIIRPLYYPFTASGNKCGGSCNAINDPYAEYMF